MIITNILRLLNSTVNHVLAVKSSGIIIYAVYKLPVDDKTKYMFLGSTALVTASYMINTYVNDKNSYYIPKILEKIEELDEGELDEGELDEEELDEEDLDESEGLNSMICKCIANNVLSTTGTIISCVILGYFSKDIRNSLNWGYSEHIFLVSSSAYMSYIISNYANSYIIKKLKY